LSALGPKADFAGWSALGAQSGHLADFRSTNSCRDQDEHSAGDPRFSIAFKTARADKRRKHTPRQLVCAAMLDHIAGFDAVLLET
jgi:hypothetical protein